MDDIVKVKLHETINESQLLTKLDLLTKQGRRQIVLRELLMVLKEKPNKAFLPKLARIANRNQAYVLALRILHNIIREDREGIQSAPPEALNIYASSLLAIGALEESQEILGRIKNSTDALLTQAFIYFAQWSYEKSIPVLTRYINSTQITPYQNHVGRINLLAALIAVGDLDSAEKLATKLNQALRQDSQHKLLLGNCCELQAQIEIDKRNYKKALFFLEEAGEHLSEQQLYLLYVDKWKAVANLSLSPSDTQALESLIAVKKRALALKSWETLRDCDFHLARILQDHESLQRILLGTPYAHFRERAQATYGIQTENSRVLKYCPSEPYSKPQRIDWNLDEISDMSFINSTSLPLLQLLTKDIYRPPRIGVVFTCLYPTEHFNPFTSPQRVRNSLFRFNDWAKNNSISFRIKVFEGEFALVGPSGAGVLCTQTSRHLGSWQAALKFFRSQNDTKSFKAESLAKALSISQSSALRILKKALAANKVKKIEGGRNSRYIFFSGRRQSAAASI